MKKRSVTAKLALSFVAFFWMQPAIAADAMEIFSEACTKSLVPISDAIDAALVKGWQVAPKSSVPVIDTIRNNYSDTEWYSSVAAFTLNKQGKNYHLVLIEGLPRLMGEIQMAGLNICILIDPDAVAPLDQNAFVAAFNPFIKPELQNFVSLRQVFYASTTAEAIPPYPLIKERPKDEVGLQGQFFFASQFSS